MLEPLRGIIDSKVLVLASSSPRRKNILDIAGLKFQVVPSNAEENVDKEKYPEPSSYSIQTAVLKAQEVHNRLAQQSMKTDLIIGADTVISLDSTIYGKPASVSDAQKMLSLFSGRSHTVYTGVALITPTDTHCFYEATEVTMDKLEADVINAYIDTGEPMDKAGAYGIQGLGGTLVKGIQGDYYNVMGFPLHHFCKKLIEMYSTS